MNKIFIIRLNDAFIMVWILICIRAIKHINEASRTLISSHLTFGCCLLFLVKPSEANETRPQLWSYSCLLFPLRLVEPEKSFWNNFFPPNFFFCYCCCRNTSTLSWKKKKEGAKNGGDTVTRNLPVWQIYCDKLPMFLGVGNKHQPTPPSPHPTHRHNQKKKLSFFFYKNPLVPRLDSQKLPYTRLSTFFSLLFILPTPPCFNERPFACQWLPYVTKRLFKEEKEIVRHSQHTHTHTHWMAYHKRTEGGRAREGKKTWEEIFYWFNFRKDWC